MSRTVAAALLLVDVVALALVVRALLRWWHRGRLDQAHDVGDAPTAVPAVAHLPVVPFAAPHRPRAGLAALLTDQAS